MDRARHQPADGAAAPSPWRLSSVTPEMALNSLPAIVVGARDLAHGRRGSPRRRTPASRAANLSMPLPRRYRCKAELHRLRAVGDRSAADCHDEIGRGGASRSAADRSRRRGVCAGIASNLPTQRTAHRAPTVSISSEVRLSVPLTISIALVSAEPVHSAQPSLPPPPVRNDLIHGPEHHTFVPARPPWTLFCFVWHVSGGNSATSCPIKGYARRAPPPGVGI